MHKFANLVLDADIQVVSFDIGNTLIDLRGEIGFCKYFCEKTHLPLDEIRPIINSCFLVNNISMKQAMRKACERLSISLTDDLIDGYIQPEPILFSDVESTLRILSNRGVLIIACSNCSKWDAENKNTILSRYVNHFFYSFELGIVKPETAFFDIVCKRISVKGEHILHVGDTLDADYIGALNAGWHAVLLDRNNLIKNAPDDVLVINTLKQIIDII